MSNSDKQKAQLKEAVYVPAHHRHDCCARCAKSALQPSGWKLTCRANGGAEVSGMAVCAKWVPIVRHVAA